MLDAEQTCETESAIGIIGGKSNPEEENSPSTALIG